jgi:hypothetical protein
MGRVNRLTLTIEGLDDNDLEFALEEVMRIVKAGLSTGYDKNETGAFYFRITEEDQQILSFAPSEPLDEESARDLLEAMAEQD